MLNANQHACWRPAPAATRTRVRRSLCRSSWIERRLRHVFRPHHAWVCGQHGRDSNGEAGAAPWLALDGDFTAHHSAQLLAEGQSEPGAAITARGRGLRLIKVLKQFRQDLGPDADAGVADGDADPIAVALLAHCA